MDSVTSQIVDYSMAFSGADMTPAASEAALKHMFDTVAVAVAGRFSEQAEIVARVVGRLRGSDDCTLVGFDHRTSPELAAFANAVMVRTFDWNDGMQAKGGGHPSDMVPGVLAVGEMVHASGRDVLVAMTLAYELLGGMGAEVPIGDFGFDQGTLMAPATALASGTLLGLDAAQMANAASLAMTPNVPLGVSRWGDLSMMKGAATAFAVRSGVFGALLAEAGMTSAPEPFAGIYGLFHLTGEFAPRLPVLPDGPSVVEMSHQKPIPVETQVLALLELVPRIRSFASVDDIESITVDVPDHAADHIADPPKYDPQTRETADHSLPYMLAVALVDGKIDLDSYLPERFLDPALRPVMARIVVRADDELSAFRHDALEGVMRPAPARILVRTTDGREMREEVAYYRGHYRNPMSRDELDAKFDEICRGRVPDDRREVIREAWWGLPESDDIRDAMGVLGTLAQEA